MKENKRTYWRKISMESLQKNDNIIARDENDNKIWLEGINSDELFEEVKKRYCTQTDDDMYKQWQHDDAAFIEEYKTQM